MRFFKSFKKSFFLLFLLGSFLVINSALAEELIKSPAASAHSVKRLVTSKTEALSMPEPMHNELLGEATNESPLLQAEANSDIYIDVVTKSFITVSQDTWEKAHANLLQVRRYWDREMEINPAQAKIIENYQAVNNALQAYLIGSYALDKVSKPNHTKARDLFDYSFDTLSNVHAEIVQLSPKLDTPITRFMTSLKKEIKDINDIIEPR
jgi:hypothetical protein